MTLRTETCRYAAVTWFGIVCGWAVAVVCVAEILPGPDWPALHKAASEGNRNMVVDILDSGYQVDARLDVTKRLDKAKRTREAKKEAYDKARSERQDLRSMHTINWLLRMDRKVSREYRRCDRQVRKQVRRNKHGVYQANTSEKSILRLLECRMAVASSLQNEASRWVREAYQYFNPAVARDELDELNNLYDREERKLKESLGKKIYVSLIRITYDHSGVTITGDPLMRSDILYSIFKKWVFAQEKKLREAHAIWEERQVRLVEITKERLRQFMKAHQAVVHLGLINGATALHIAALSGNVGVMELLIGKGASIEANTKNGMRPLHAAAFGSNRAAANLLVTRGADVNSRAEGRVQPLHVAVRMKSINVAEVLLRNGADPAAATLDGTTPLDIARAREESGGVLTELLEHYLITMSMP